MKRALVALVCRHENLRSSLSVEEDAAWLEISDAVADFFEVVDGGVRGFLERDAALALLSDRLQSRTMSKRARSCGRYWWSKARTPSPMPDSWTSGHLAVNREVSVCASPSRHM